MPNAHSPKCCQRSVKITGLLSVNENAQTTENVAVLWSHVYVLSWANGVANGVKPSDVAQNSSRGKSDLIMIHEFYERLLRKSTEEGTKQRTLCMRN